MKLFRGNGDGTFLKHPKQFLGDDLGFTAFSAHDWNGDGKIDLMLIGYNGEADYYPGLGGGEFGQPQRYTSPGNPEFCLVADFSGDGLDDLAVVGEDSAIALYLGQPGNSGTPLSSPVFFGVGIYFGPAAVADFNEDGRPDIAASGNYPDRTVIFLNRD